MNPANDFDELSDTRAIPRETMRALVFGTPARRPVRFPSRLIFIAAVAMLSVGCATARPVEVEAVGQLSASATHVTVQALKHDAPPEFAGVVDSGDDVGEVVTTVVRAPDADADVTPEVAPKTDGVVTGSVR